MIKVIITSARVSPGYNNAAAVQLGQDHQFAKFRIGNKVYDKNADGNSRWINYTVKAFGPLVDRVDRMKLTSGSHINLVGRLDEDTWQTENGETRTSPVIYLEDIEYCYVPKEPGNGTSAGNQAPTQNSHPSPGQPQQQSKQTAQAAPATQRLAEAPAPLPG